MKMIFHLSVQFWDLILETIIGTYYWILAGNWLHNFPSNNVLEITILTKVENRGAEVHLFGNLTSLGQWTD